MRTSTTVANDGLFCVVISGGVFAILKCFEQKRVQKSDTSLFFLCSLLVIVESLTQVKMPKKQQSKSPFYYFMIDWKKSMESIGESFNGLAAVQKDSRCSEEWQNLPLERKAHYRKLAKESKFTLQKKKMEKPLSDLETKIQQQLEFKENMQTTIKNQLQVAYNKNELLTMKFYFIHVNWFYSQLTKEQDYVYLPAEYAIAEFSLLEGITRFEHKLIYSVAQSGYTREAIEHSQLSHKIPLELDGGEKDYVIMYNDLLKFLKPAIVNNMLPPLYAEKRVYDAVPSLLNKMTDAAGYENKFVVYSVEYLFAVLYQLSSQIPISYTIAQEEFSKDRFIFEPGTECEFHKNIDGGTQYCSLSVVKQWGFTICDYCCQRLGIKLVPGVHIPDRKAYNVVENLSTTMQFLSVNNHIKSSSGVGGKYKSKSSVEASKDDRRCKENRPLHVINHAEINEQKAKEQDTSVVVDNDKPLRRPKSFANALGDERVPYLNDIDFPSIRGRGSRIERRTKNAVKVSSEN